MKATAILPPRWKATLRSLKKVYTPSSTAQVHTMKPAHSADTQAGWEIVVHPVHCGDGLRLSMEECDDGNFIEDDGCSAHCKVLPGWICSGGSSFSRDHCHKLQQDDLSLRCEGTFLPTS